MARQSEKRVEPSWYYLEGEDEQAADTARFEIRAITSSEQIDVLATFQAGAPNALTFRKCFQIGVNKIENWTDGDGKPIKTSLAFLIQQDTLNEVLEVGSAVFDKSYLTDEQKKT